MGRTASEHRLHHLPASRAAWRAQALSLAVGVVAMLAAGCAIVPIPTGRHVPKGSNVRGRITAAVLDSLGSAPRRRDVLLALGEPDRTWENGRFLFYRWTTVGGYWGWMLAAGYQGAGGLVPYGEREHDLLFEFDDTGRLRKRGTLGAWGEGPVEDGDESGRPLPIELHVGHLDASGDHPSYLTLDRSEIHFTDAARRRHEVRLALERVEAVRFRQFGQLPLADNRMGCELVYSVGDNRRRKLRLLLYPEDMLILLGHLRHGRSGIRFEGMSTGPP